MDEDKGKSSCAALQAEFAEENVKFYKADVTNREELVSVSTYSMISIILMVLCLKISSQEAVFSRTKMEFGAIDILCNIAGVLELPDWRKTVDINLVKTIYLVF